MYETPCLRKPSIPSPFYLAVPDQRIVQRSASHRSQEILTPVSDMHLEDIQDEPIEKG